MKRQCSLFIVGSCLAVCIGQVCTAGDEGEKPQAEATIRARVVDKVTGQPIEGASVRVASKELPSLDLSDERFRNELFERNGWRDPPAARSNDRGLATCAPLPRGRHAIEVWADGYVTQWKEFLIGGGAFEAEIEFRLSPGVSVEGTVRDAEGAPLAARVTFHARPAEFGEAVVNDAEGRPRTVRIAYYPPFADWGQDAASEAATDANGDYRLPFVPIDADIGLTASPIGPGYLFGSRNLHASADAPARIDFALERRPPSAAVRGLVVDESGAPVAGAVVEVVFYNRPVQTQRDPHQTTTAADGRFRLDDLAGGTALLKTSAPGFALDFRRVPLGPQAAADEARVVLKPGRHLRARVVDERNAPLPEVEVFMPSSLLCRTDAEGRFETNIVPEDSSFTFRKQGYSTIWSRRLELDSSKEIVIAMNRSGVIRAKVFDGANGRAVREFVVGRSAGRPLHVYAGDGSFELDESWQNARVVDAKGYFRRVLPVMSPAAPSEGRLIEIALDFDDPATYVQYGGQVTDDSGSPVADVELRLLCAVDRPGMDEHDQIINRFDRIVKGQAAQHDRITRCESAVSDRQGRFSFAAAPRTPHVFIVWWKEGMAPGKQVHLEQLPGAEAGRLELRADPPASVALHIDRQAFPEAAEIFVFRSHFEPIVQLHTNLRLDLNPALNSFEISDLPAGDYQVQLRGAARASRVLARRSFRLGRGEKLRVDLTAEDREADRRGKR